MFSSLQSRVVFDSCLPLGHLSSYWVALLAKQDIHLPGLSFSLSGYDINIPYLGLGFEGKQVRKGNWQHSGIHPSFLPAFSSFDVRGRAWSYCSLLCHIGCCFWKAYSFLGTGELCGCDVIHERRINKKKKTIQISARYFILFLMSSLWLPLYMLAKPTLSNTGVLALQPCELVVSLQVSMTSESLEKRCILPGYPGSRRSAVFQMTDLRTPQHGSGPGSLHVCHRRGILKCLHQAGPPKCCFCAA